MGRCWTSRAGSRSPARTRPRGRLGWLDAVHPADRARAGEDWSVSLRTGDIYEAEYRIRGPAGSYRWTAARAVPLRGADGGISQWIGVNTDIETRKQAEHALRASEARFRTLAEACRIWSGRPMRPASRITSTRAGRQ